MKHFSTYYVYVRMGLNVGYYNEKDISNRLKDMLVSGELIYKGKSNELKFDTPEFAVHKILAYPEIRPCYVVDLSVDSRASTFSNISTLWYTGPAMIIPYVYGYGSNQTIFNINNYTYGSYITT